MESHGSSSNSDFPNAPKNGIRLTNQRCKCMKRAMLLIAETERNKYTSFFKCDKCKFFMWLDSTHIISPIREPTTIELKDNLEKIEKKVDALLKMKENFKLEQGIKLKFGVMFLIVVVVVVVLGCNK